MFSLEEYNFRQRLLEKLDENELRFIKLAYIRRFPVKSCIRRLKDLKVRKKELNLMGKLKL